MTRVRRIAILIDGGFFIKRLPRLVGLQFCDSPEAVADSARHLCKRHVQKLIHSDENEADGVWLDQVYRLFFYDAEPYDGTSHHPLANRRIDYGKTETATFRRELFSQLRKKRKFALRLGTVQKTSDWQISPALTKKLLKTQKWMKVLEETVIEGDAPPQLSADELAQLNRVLATWNELEERHIGLELRQKGVDMRIGLDIASLALKKQADTIVLVTGDSDFVPAAKLARREGIEFLVDPMWQSVSDDLNEHVDGIVSAFPPPDKSASSRAEDQGATE
ncbi:NYN domain-containing protein [Thioalkalivibrio sp. ALJ24]|uniref:NYN domain-containing protein n=1 Tax=Thioalkalivibrio sp. ALJ24 TaxID=545276 RepID=UPI0003629CA1|nr:NYN domain-containing protein [Thioalkalivibrio sp. ALJ24]